MPWRNRPFLRILFFFATGILAARMLPVQNVPPEWYILLFAFFTGTAFISVFGKVSYRYLWIQGFFLYAALFVTGFVFTQTALEKSNGQMTTEKGIWQGKLISEPEQRPGNIRFILKIVRRVDKGKRFRLPVKVMVRLMTDSLPQNLHLGNEMVFSGRLTPVKPPLNPYEFDYRRFLEDKGIRYQTYLYPHVWIRLHDSPGFSLTALFAKWRNRLLKVLHSEKLSPEEFGVAAAILLGYDRLIAPGLHHDFTAAGAVHILCVSGMHVGIIYLIFSLLFAFLLRFQNGKFIRGILLLFILWSYALLTGMSPSVSRAATMLSLFITADILGRPYDNFNLLAASAFLLLAFHPLLLFDVGFQLSYAAVAGILLFYFPIYRSLYLPGKVLRMFWAALAVSFSAQLGAFAIAAHYFHQFPLYFLLTNLAVFGLAYIIIFSGLAYLLFSWLPVAGHLMASVLARTTGWLIAIVHFMASLPHAAVYDLYFPWSKVFLVFLFIAACYYLFVHKKRQAAIAALVTLVLFAGINLRRQIRLQRQKKLIVYCLRHNTAIRMVNGKQSLLLGDAVAIHQPAVLDYSLKNHRIALGLKRNLHPLTGSFQNDLFYYRAGFGETNGYRFYITSPGKRYYPKLHHKIEVELLLCRPPWKTTLKEIAHAITFHQVLLEASLPSWSEKQIRYEAKLLGIRTIDLKNRGAYSLNLMEK